MRVPRPAPLVPALTAVLLLAGCGSGEDEAQPQEAASAPAESSTSAAAAEPVTVGDCTYNPVGTSAGGEVDLPAEDDVVTEGTIAATIVTSAGDVPLELDAANAPCTVASFTHLAREDYFDGTVCHRLTSQDIFVLQCGDPSGTGTGGPGYQFTTENTEGATYGRGTLAMARTPDPESNGSQFFLVYQDSPLPPEYSVFGTVTEAGLAVLDKVAAAGAEGGAPDGAPSTPVEVTDVALAQ